MTDTEKLLATLLNARHSNDMDEMREALTQASDFIRKGVAEAMSAGTRAERAERIFDALGYSDIADDGKQTTAMFVCEYLNQRMDQDGRTRCKTEYYEDMAGALDRDISVVQGIWREYRDSHKRIDLGISTAELLDLARHSLDQQGQRLRGEYVKQ